MKRNSKAVLALGVLAAALIAAGGAAFTNSNSLPQTTTAGYGSSTVTGATATSIVYNPSPDGTTIQSVTIVLNGPRPAALRNTRSTPTTATATPSRVDSAGAPVA
jgi:hypothetical protein